MRAIREVSSVVLIILGLIAFSCVFVPVLLVRAVWDIFGESADDLWQ